MAIGQKPPELEVCLDYVRAHRPCTIGASVLSMNRGRPPAHIRWTKKNPPTNRGAEDLVRNSGWGCTKESPDQATHSPQTIARHRMTNNPLPIIGARLRMGGNDFVLHHCAVILPMSITSDHQA